MDITLSMFPRPYMPIGKNFFIYPNKPQKIVVKWKSLRAALDRFREVDQKQDAPLWSPAEFKFGETRKSQHVIALSCLVLDFDDGDDPAEARKPWQEYNHAIHASFRHTFAHPKYRIVVPFSRPVPAHRWSAVWSHCFEIASSTGCTPDKSCSDPSRMYYVPACPEESSEHFSAYTDTGVFFRVNAEVLASAARPVYKPPTEWKTRQRFDRSGPDYKADTHARATLAQRIGAAVTGNKAHRIKCPACHKDTVWYIIEPDKKYTAECNHRNSCGWYGNLKELG